MKYGDFSSLVQLGAGLHIGTAFLQVYGELGVELDVEIDRDGFFGRHDLNRRRASGQKRRQAQPQEKGPAPPDIRRYRAKIQGVVLLVARRSSSWTISRERGSPS